VRVDGAAVMDRVRRIIAEGSAFYERHLTRHDGIRIVRERARFRAGRLAIGERELDGVPVILATGARPALPPIPGREDVPYVTSDELIVAEELPRSIAIVGGGPIGVEFAQALARLDVEVHLIFRRVMPLAEEELDAGEVLAHALARDGVHVNPSCIGVELSRRGGGRVHVRWDDGAVDVDTVLLATGREPTVADLDPDAAGLELERGGVRVDERLATSVPGIWAIGDAVGGHHLHYQFTHVATHEGPIAVENALNGRARTVSYDAMPRVTFTDPEVAAVGLTELQARARGYDVLCNKKPIRQLGKARSIGEEHGFVKVVLDRATGKLLGGSIVASHAGDMLAELTMPLHADGGSLDALLATTFPHPTLSEGVKVAVRDAWKRLELATSPDEGPR
jgi:mercuric reductase